jgi:plastocyanin
MKRTTRQRIGLTLAAGVAALSLSIGAGFAPTAVTAQEASHPAHIHNGSCDAPGDVIAPLNNLTGDPASSVSTVEQTVNDLLATPHAIVVHESDANIGNYLACGNIAGVTSDGMLTVGLAELNGSGYEGIAILSANATAGTDVNAIVLDDAKVEGMAMPAATDSHPAHIHSGDCTAPGDVQFPLTDVAPVAGDAMGGTPSLMVEQSSTEVETTVADLTAAPHAIVAHLSKDEIGTYLVCGDITAGADGMAIVPLKELAGSGYVGVAVLKDGDAGKLGVWLFLFPGVSGGMGGGMASPEANMGGMDHSGMGSPEASSGMTVSASIAGFKFDPATLEVTVGTTVTWTNNDSTAHTVTADDGSFQSGKIDPGASWSYTFDTAGTFAYHCEYHSGMTGTVTVS